jgi:hypothetical protein
LATLKVAQLLGARFALTIRALLGHGFVSGGHLAGASRFYRRRRLREGRCHAARKQCRADKNTQEPWHGPNSVFAKNVKCGAPSLYFAGRLGESSDVRRHRKTFGANLSTVNCSSGKKFARVSLHPQMEPGGQQPAAARAGISVF